MAEYVELDRVSEECRVGTVIVEFKRGYPFASHVQQRVPDDLCFGWMPGARVSWSSIESDIEKHLKPELKLKAKASRSWTTDGKGLRH